MGALEVVVEIPPPPPDEVEVGALLLVVGKVVGPATTTMVTVIQGFVGSNANQKLYSVTGDLSVLRVDLPGLPGGEYLNS